MIRQLEDLDDLEKLALIDFSFSRLDTYETCPAKYFYTYIQKEDRLFGPAAALGNVVHGVLEETVGEPLDLSDMLMVMDQQREIYDPEQEIDEALISAGIVMLTEYVDRHAEDKMDLIANEFPFSVVIGSALVNGFIDRVERMPNGAIRIVDYKTGKWEYRGEPKDNLQLGIYALVMSHHYPNTPIQADLYYLRSGRIKGHLFTPQELEDIEDKLVDQFLEIIESRNFNPTPGYYCSFCDFREICPKAR